ncbi:DUF4926 domain-containing protein [Geminocystis sp. GBBB08]|uniref:DUF4926 domain-containing protein n=1 Tax=Geminocystis sp. GBBB08 TaxID=2604140 RepID=UPI0027E3477C|nr:DUF4926 domain-containing protein [Geminocystis sp. GBBB08]MBL1210357.1 DUF4926 domain-containing protein [Geminocystis sp. GBBB08]
MILRKGQVRTIVEIYPELKAFEVEFSDKHGQTYGLISLEIYQLMLLYPDNSNLSLVG